MTEQINDQISAFIDDELSEQECALLVRRFERDTDSRNQAQRYALIGAALRNELLRPDHGVLRRRIASALDGAPAAPAHPAAAALPNVPVPQRAPLRWQSRYLRPVAGFGIAATVAVVAIVGLREVNDGAGGAAAPTTAFNASPPPAARQWTEPASYTVPQDVSDAPTVAPQIRLTNYLVHHGEYTSGLSRTSVHSNVVGAAEVVGPGEELAPPLPPRPEELEAPAQ